MNGKSSSQDIKNEIKQEYEKFLAELDVLKKKQDELIKEYQEKLQQRNLARIEEQQDLKE